VAGGALGAACARSAARTQASARASRWRFWWAAHGPQPISSCIRHWRAPAANPNTLP